MYAISPVLTICHFSLFIYLFRPAYGAYMIFHCGYNDFSRILSSRWDFVFKNFAMYFFRRDVGDAKMEEL